MDNDKAADHEEISEDFPHDRPLHVKTDTITVRWEVNRGGITGSDPQTAHNAAGDPLYEKRLPETCGSCQAEALAKAARDKGNA